MTATAAARSGSSAIVRDVLERAADPEQWERFERQLRSTGYCRRPIRLRGRVDAVDLATGEVRTVYSTDREPDETLLKCCGNRREAVCPSCAQTYRGDAFQLVAAGMRGGKGVPESVVEHPMLFVTLTAPSFGLGALAPHRRRGEARRCRPRRKAEVCRHGVRLSCSDCTTRTIPGSASRCARAALTTSTRCCGTRWPRRCGATPQTRSRASSPGWSERSERKLRRRVRVSYVKVAEYQRRGALHFHVLVRLDRAQPPDEADEGRAAAGRVHGRAARASRARRGRAHRRCTPPLPSPAIGTRPRRARCAGDRRPRSDRSNSTGLGRGGAHRGLHRQVRDQEHRSRRAG